MHGCGNQIAPFQCQIPLLWMPYFLFENNEGYFRKSSKIILLLALGWCSSAYASATQKLPLDEAGCLSKPLQIKRGGAVYYFDSPTDTGLMLSFEPISPDVVVKNPKGKKVALEVGRIGGNDEGGFSFAEIIDKGRYTIHFPRAGKIESLCINGGELGTIAAGRLGSQSGSCQSAYIVFISNRTLNRKAV